MELTATNVDQIFKYCLSLEDKENLVTVDGVRIKANLDPFKLKEKEADIISMLSHLPDDFKQSIGGGMSFLNMCVDDKEKQWTGEHLIVDQLFLLGNAINKAKFLMPRENWDMFIAGMPYIVILDK